MSPLTTVACAGLLSVLVGCGSMGLFADDSPPPEPVNVAAQPPAAQPIQPTLQQPPQPTPPPGSDAWLEEYKRKLSAIRAGQAIAAQDTAAQQPAPVLPPVTQPAQPVVQEPVAVQPQPEPAAPPVQAPMPIRQDELATILNQSRQHAALVDDRVAALVSAFIQEGLAAMAADDLAAAHQHFGHAYELDPDDPAARDLYQRTSALLGKPGGALGSVAESAREKAAARRDQTGLMAQQYLAEGDAAMARNNFETAVQHFEDALALVKFAPDAASGPVTASNIAARVSLAKRAALDAQSMRDNELLQRAVDLQENYDRAEATRTERRIDQLLDNANDAFLSDEYVAAEAALDEVLAASPNNEEARNLKGIVVKARHQERDTRTRKIYRTEWQDTFDNLEQEHMPQNDLIMFPDADTWAITTSRNEKQFSGAGGLDTDLDLAAAERLKKSIPVSFQDEPLDEVIKHLSAVSGVNFLVSRDAADAATDNTYTLEDRNAQPIERVLKILLEDLSLPPLDYSIRDGVVRIITSDEARSDYVLQMYDIRDLTFTPTDYKADDFNLLPSGTDADSHLDGVEDEDPLPLIGADALLTLIQDNIAVDSWIEDPERTIQLMPGTLVVRQTPDVHMQIRALVDDLRVNTNTMIHIETRFIEVEDSFLEDIGVDLRGLDGALTGGFPLEDFGQSGGGGFGTPSNPLGIGTGNDPGFYYGGSNGDIKGRIENLYDFTLGEAGTLNGAGGLSLQALFFDDTSVELVMRAVTKYQTSNIVNAPNLMLRSGQRGNVKSLITRTYVRDFEPEIAQAAVIAQPELDNVKEGVVLDVRAVASADRRFITLELRPTVTDLIPDASGAALPQATVSLGTQNSNNVTIELPELRIQRLRTTATIPDGATLMLGGLKRSVEQNFKSGVPFLSDIPILGSLFSRQGEYTSKRKLIILLKATIVAPEEHEPSLGFQR
jgi:type II secretory pathway component GspD/PulD (secretin)